MFIFQIQIGDLQHHSPNIHHQKTKNWLFQFAFLSFISTNSDIP